MANHFHKKSPNMSENIYVHVLAVADNKNGLNNFQIYNGGHKMKALLLGNVRFFVF